MRVIALILALCGSGWAAEAPGIQELLRNTGKAVESFWSQFSTVNCREAVAQAKLDKSGKVVQHNDSAYDYLVLMRQKEEDLVVEESRVAVPQPGSKAAATTPLLVTNGFSTFLLIFHPRFQHSYEFSKPVEEEQEGKSVLRVDFRQIRNARAPSCLRLRGHDYPLEWVGSAWIDTHSWAVLKISAALGSSMEDLGLKSLSAEVTYSPVKFGEGGGEQWLPALATIEASTPLQRWRNTHRFTDYKHFSVDTSTKTELPQ